MCYPHPPTTYPTQNANFVVVADCVGRQLRRRHGTVYDRNAGSESRDIRTPSYLYWIICKYVGMLVVTSKGQEEIRVDVVFSRDEQV